MSNSRNKISTPNAPQAIGPYSQAVRVKDLIFVSGQLPIDPKTAKLVASDVTLQTQQVIDNIEAILQAEGLNLNHVVRCDVFLKNMEDFPKMNAVYAKRFTSDILPARQTIEVARLPSDALVEISCIASA